MSLPKELSDIFKHKQKSYKMVLILSLLDEIEHANRQEASIDRIKQQFLSHFQQREANGEIVDPPPNSIGENWNDIRVQQISSLIQSPIDALSGILTYDAEQKTLQFTPKIQAKLLAQTFTELRRYALTELSNYYSISNSHAPSLENEQVVGLISDSTVVNHIERIKFYIKRKGYLLPDQLIENIYLSLKTKPFLILAGISGTGKTKLVKRFAEAMGATSANGQFALIPVRPDWNDPTDLIGYKDLSGVFRAGQFTEILVEASKPENVHKPYFVCLDEMNLARVEYYFSDILSIMESAEREDDRIVTHKLISKELLSNEKDQQKYGALILPDNVYVIGTVNMDETTHPFSKKVLDRATTIEFNEIDLEQFPYIEASQENEQAIVPLSNRILSREYIELIDCFSAFEQEVRQISATLAQINTILEDIHAHVGYRVRDSICFYMLYNKRFQLVTDETAFDWQVIQRILPRIQGSSYAVKKVLLKLLAFASGEQLQVGQLIDDASDVIQRYIAREQPTTVRYPHSSRKIAHMLRRIEEDGFTSYWIS